MEENSKKKNVSLNITPVGKMNVKINPDGTASVSSEEEIVLNDIKLKAVSIGNIIDLKSYGMTVNEERTMHLIEFKDGGRFELTYNSLGKIETCAGNDVQIAVQGGDTLIVKQKTTNALP